MTNKRYHVPDGIYLDEYPGCCGIEIATGFDCEEFSKNRWSHSDDEGITLEEWHKKAYEQILRKRNCRHVQLSLVSSYAKDPKKEQVPGFISFLKKKRWKKIAEFVNPNHGNTVIVFGKVFAKEGKPDSDYYW